MLTEESFWSWFGSLALGSGHTGLRPKANLACSPSQRLALSHRRRWMPDMTAASALFARRRSLGGCSPLRKARSRLWHLGRARAAYNEHRLAAWVRQRVCSTRNRTPVAPASARQAKLVPKSRQHPPPGRTAAQVQALARLCHLRGARLERLLRGRRSQHSVGPQPLRHENPGLRANSPRRRARRHICDGQGHLALRRAFRPPARCALPASK